MSTAVSNATTALLSDRDLVDQVLYGDELAFDELYRRFSGMVYGVALRMAGDPARAEDWTQEVFLRLHKHLGGYRHQAALKTWVYRVAINVCRSRARRGSWFRAAPVERLETHADPGLSPERRALDRDLAARVVAALPRIPRKFREAVVLRDIERLSYQEIAQVLGVRVGTVRSRIARGRERLRSLLEDR